jgi:tetratricopeptide (TPR) repeat protein
MNRALLKAVVLTALLAGAARADSGWREIRGPHVVLRTDLGSGAAKESALAVERFRAQVIAAAWPRATLPAGDRVEVTVFGNGLDFERHFGRNISAVFFHGVPPFAVMWGTPEKWENRATLATSETTSILRHELVHHLAASVYRRQPRWFAEGLAQFLETVRPGDDGKTVVIGAANLDAMRKYNSFRSVRVADALAWSAKLDALPEGTVHGLYGLSWLMVHWMFNEHPAQFEQYQGLLARGIDPDKAWRVILPGLNTPDIDGALNQYLKHGNYNEFAAPYTPPSPPLEERPLSEADVHAEQARVALAAAGSSAEPAKHREEAEREIAAALKLDPGNVGALALEAGRKPPPERAAIARRMTTAHPEDGRGWLMLGQALAPSGDPAATAEREAAFKKAIALRPDDPTPLNDLAWTYASQGKAADAAPLINKAIQLAPYDPSVLDTLAAVQAQLGRCSEAVATEARAIDVLPEGVGAATQRRFEARLEQYRTRCVSNAAATGTGTGG